MTNLSINLNKIALLRNSRGRDYPNVIDMAKKFIDLGVQGITIHPRPDERHITQQDVIDLGGFLANYDKVELNIEGYPSKEFLALVKQAKPKQCTLVPDNPDQLTSDHGWDVAKEGRFLQTICSRLSKQGIRTAIFLDPDVREVKFLKETGVDRIELYTESYASSYETEQHNKIFNQFKETAFQAQQIGLGVNAGHDLDLLNLPKFLTIDNILEVSIGHALSVECIEQGMIPVTQKYLEICSKG